MASWVSKTMKVTDAKNFFTGMLASVTFGNRLKLQKFMSTSVCIHSWTCHSRDMSGVTYVSPRLSSNVSRRGNHDARWWDSNHVTSTSVKNNAVIAETSTTKETSSKQRRSIAGSSVLYEYSRQLESGENRKWTLVDWEMFESKVLAENIKLGKLWEGFCMNLLFHYGLVDTGHSLMQHIKGKGRSPNMTTRTAFIALCGWYGGKHYQNETLSTYKELLEVSDVFDGHSCKQLIYGLCGTDQWRDAIPFLEMTKLSQEPSTSFYTPIIVAALRHKDISCALQMLDIVGDGNAQPQPKAFLALVEFCTTNSKLLTFHHLFEYLRKYSWFPNKEVMQNLADACESKGWHVFWTKMTARGVCNSCGHTAGSADLNEEEFNELKDRFLEKAVISGDVFMKSNPAEMKKFYGFIKNTAPYDVVLDALNIALGISSKFRKDVKADVLVSAVDYFWRRQQKVLVLGRKHLTSFPEKQMSLVHQKARCFYIDNMSADDPLLLYAALYSGPHTLVVSSDEMRDHKHLLGTKLGALFTQWQRSRQVYVVGYVKHRKEIHLLMPKAFDTLAQQDSNGWHIPYEDREERSSYQHPNAWLCLRENS